MRILWVNHKRDTILYQQCIGDSVEQCIQTIIALIQKSATAVTRFVASEERAIGYCYLDELTGKEKGIRVLKVEGVTPTAASIKSGVYKLR